ncbi:bifunctional biotin--[acetyl-CoA-carboxylase] ligase/biotin operon repressor BirA [Pseudomonas sp. FSL R10-1350]|uniref:bifunctional biotin--[acetyl-CoA-carboxylase] ligase/biotin operon repressor BirA n=1 Tax=Pseudomonas TaxID=286 RepID=UPI00065D27D4|nr:MULTISPECIES: bifunctional biotin--[acetyl-CoA-carboxylase] ligase/biotin operon repressor BirA [Pseudomonas]KMM98027.1 biotin--protein ligase [Pseudomonas helleri]MQT58153.1 bifunctional biotin--[acetyl-CoA-carboxylase] ligase/biotin operon repressor BirA [Pseudomonas sp. FSL R10-0399]MQU63805.1 bifunctional biotin--[acetyl-CoA-carboxylase] ligase/biotin operon repressor BirA [Pseudomonas sp. FSL R10-1350]
MLTLLKLLKDGRFHSGQALGAALGISRSAVWKQLQRLEADLNLPIHKVRGRGYQLAAPLELLERDQLADSPYPVSIHESLDSTNAEALREISGGVQAPFVILAEQQSAGRGRRGRKWISPFAENIYYSLVLRIDGGMRQLEGLSLIVGLAVLSSLREFGSRDAGLKWPNDVLVGNKKIAGILLELVGDPADVCHVVIGIGINVNMMVASDVDQSWTSVRLEAGQAINRNELIVALGRNLQGYLIRHEAEGFAAIQAEWESNHLWQGREVTLIAGTHTVDGVVAGVDQQGALRLNVAGQEKVFSGGELSLRLRHDS